MAKVWKKLQRSDSAFTGDVTGTINGTSASTIKSGSALGASSNQDSTSTIRSGTTAANVGLGNVPNYSAATMRAGVTSSDVGLGNVANESRATILGGTFTGNVTGTVNGASAAAIKSGAASGTSAKSAVDGNASITMVGGSLSIGTVASGVYPFSVDSSGNLKIKNDEFQALADGTVNCKGSFTINQDASSNSKIELAGSTSGTATVLVNGANPTFDLGGATPLGTATLHLKRKLTSNQSRVQFRTGSSGSEFTIGNSNNSGLTTQYAIHTGPLWSSGTVSERALSFDADGKMGMYSNSKTVAGFTFGSDGTNKHVYVKNGGLGVGVANTTDGTLETSGDTTVGGDLDVTGTALTGWHTKDVIWVMPTDFYVNDDQSYYNMALVDSGGALKPMTTSLEAYTNIPIPSGYKVTHFRVNGTASVGIAAYYSDCTTGGQTSCQPPTSIYTNTLYATNPSSGIEASDTNGRYFILKWSCSSTSHRLYGGYLKIAKI
jgi:hypothetical protein